MFRSSSKTIKLIYFVSFFCVYSCSGGGTLGSSSSGGVTIKGQARTSENNEPIANSPMRVISLDGILEILSSQTNSNGEFEMNLAETEESVIFDIENATSGVQVDKDLLNADQLKLEILDQKNIVTEIVKYLSVKLETLGSCEKTYSTENAEYEIGINNTETVCIVNLNAKYYLADNSKQAKVSICGVPVGEIQNNRNTQFEISSCATNKLDVVFENLKITYNIKEN